DPSSDNFIKERARLSSVEVNVRPKFDTLESSTLSKEQIKRLKTQAPEAISRETTPVPTPLPAPQPAAAPSVYRPQSRSRTGALAVTATFFVALLTLVGWTLLTGSVRTELPWLAPIAGLAIGLPALGTGGRGIRMGIITAITALLALAGGRMISVYAQWHITSA